MHSRVLAVLLPVTFVLALSFLPGCERKQDKANPPARAEKEDEVPPVGNSKAASLTRAEFVTKLRQAFSEDGRKPKELAKEIGGALTGGTANAATIEQMFGKPDQVETERSDGKPTWYWHLKDGSVGLDIVEEKQEGNTRLVVVSGVSEVGVKR